jgi:hypothetical protein
MTTTMDRSGRSLVAPELFERLSRRVAEEAGVEPIDAEVITEQTLVFLEACAENPTLMLSPSERVDVGWHVFLLHTYDYLEFCTRVAGRFIHHTPTAGPGGGGAGHEATLEALRRTGLAVDWSLWPSHGADCRDCKKCTQCYQGCHDSP